MIIVGEKYRFHYDFDIANDGDEERDLCANNNGHIVKVLSHECELSGLNLYHVVSDTDSELFAFECELLEEE